MINLRDYQEEALAAIGQSSAKRQLLALPTGTGKTVVFSELIRRRGGTALILAHRDELLQQAAKKLVTVAPEYAVSVGFVQAGRNDTHAPIVIASVQTLARERRLAALAKRFDTVIIDEAHHATADSYRRIVEAVETPLLVGVTATPERHDKGRLGDVFEELVYARSLEEMIRLGYLSDLRGIRVKLQGLDLSTVKRSRGDFQAEDLGRALSDAGAVEHAVGAYLEHAPGRRAISFFPTVALSKEAAREFTDNGVACAHLDGETDPAARRAIIEALGDGQLDMVCNVGVLTEGFDEPALGCVLIAAPTKSRIKYVQMVGRGTRIYPGKKDCVILDLAGVTERLSVQSIGLLFGLKTAPKKDETMVQALDRERKAEQSKLERSSRRGGVRRSREVELFHRDRIHWLELGGRWAVALSKNFIVLDPQREPLGSWRVLEMLPNRTKVKARNLDLGYAQGVAEQMIRDAQKIGLVDREARWRKREASAGQRGLLGRLGLPITDGLTAGEAADAINLKFLSDRLARFDRGLASQPRYAA